MPAGWQPWLAAAVFVLDVAASMHAVLHKRDVRAAISWVGLIWLVPGVGALLYALLGLNRIRRQAMELQRERRRIVSGWSDGEAPAWLAPNVQRRVQGLARLTETLSGRPLLGGNGIEPLIDGDQAYPEMLAAIDQATRSVALCSYIFADDRAGRRFIDALARAVRRGVEVRVLIDDVGVRYSFPPVHWALRRAGVRVARFLPIVSRSGIAFFNLRTHRKVLIADGEVAFTGGMNIQGRNILADRPGHPVRDVHFRVRGPVVRQLTDAFAEDWAFATREILDGPRWYPAVARHGGIAARVITDGPDRDFEIVRNVLIGALSTARESVRIVTPYFLPDASMLASLAVASLRGVRVDIVLPARVNIPLAQWATAALLWQVLKPGCRVHLSPPPFDHAKLFVIDRSWALVGTSNWDPRSLRLNFELDLECHDADFAAALDGLVERRIAASRPFTLEDADGRSLPVRLRDGLARLLSPYL